MKKTSFLILAAFVSAIFFYSSCDKEITSTAYSIDTTKTATIIIEAYANIDQSDIGYEAAPNGTQFITSVSKSDFVPGASTNITETVTIQANGRITITVPVDDNGVNYTIIPQDFTYNQTQNDVAYQQAIPKLYKSLQQGIFLRTGESRTLQFFYTEYQQYDFNELVNISGHFLADLNDTIAGFDTLSWAQSAIFHTASNDWSTTVTCNTNGEFSVDVPKNTAIYFNCDFTANKVVLVDTVYLPRPYRYKITSGEVSNSTQSIANDGALANFGAGVAVK